MSDWSGHWISSCCWWVSKGRLRFINGRMINVCILRTALSPSQGLLSHMSLKSLIKHQIMRNQIVLCVYACSTPYIHAFLKSWKILQPLWLLNHFCLLKAAAWLKWPKILFDILLLKITVKQNAAQWVSYFMKVFWHFLHNASFYSQTSDST